MVGGWLGGSRGQTPRTARKLAEDRAFTSLSISLCNSIDYRHYLSRTEESLSILLKMSVSRPSLTSLMSRRLKQSSLSESKYQEDNKRLKDPTRNIKLQLHAEFAECITGYLRPRNNPQLCENDKKCQIVNENWRKSVLAVLTFGPGTGQLAGVIHVGAVSDH